MSVRVPASPCRTEPYHAGPCRVKHETILPAGSVRFCVQLDRAAAVQQTGYFQNWVLWCFAHVNDRGEALSRFAIARSITATAMPPQRLRCLRADAVPFVPAELRCATIVRCAFVDALRGALMQRRV